MNNKWPVVINNPNQSVYRTPVKQFKESPSAPNGRHIYGDAADMAVANANYALARDSALSLTPKPCVESQTPLVPHIHMDYRTLGGVTRSHACPPGWPHTIGG
jgi:hypothetical protein